PVVWFSTYLGGSGEEYGNDIAVDSACNVYAAGKTISTNFPTLNAYQSSNNLSSSNQPSTDGYITKYDPNGVVLYSTYLGGSGFDNAGPIAIDSSGKIYVAGYTQSTNYPTMSAYQSILRGSQDAFLTVLNSSGSSLAYSTYLGGTAPSVIEDGRSL